MVEVQRFTAKEKIKREYKLLDNSASIQCSNSLVYFCVYVYFYTGETPGQGCRAFPGNVFLLDTVAKYTVTV